MGAATRTRGDDDGSDRDGEYEIDDGEYDVYNEDGEDQIGDEDGQHKDSNKGSQPKNKDKDVKIDYDTAQQGDVPLWSV